MSAPFKTGGVRVIPNTDASQVNKLSLAAKNNLHAVSLQSPDTLAGNVALTMPNALGTAGTFLEDVAGTGVLSWGTPGSAGQPAAVGVCVDGGGSVPATGSKGFMQVPYNCTITGWTLLADQSGSCQFTVKKSTYSGFPTTASIVASAPPILSSAQKATSTTLTGWTTAITLGDVLEFNLDSSATVIRVILQLQVTKT